MTNRDPFFSALQSLPQFVGETDATFDQALDWVLDQCDWTFAMLSNAEFRMFEELFDEVVG
jgi:hypothetical protein